MSSYSRENPDAPELDAGEIEERAPRTATPPKTLKASDGTPAADDAISESEVSVITGIRQNTLSRQRRTGALNPKLLLVNDSPFARTSGGGTPIWYRRSLVEAIANGTTDEPWYVR